MSADDDVQPFAGELFLALAAEGRLVLAADTADQMIADLERTLATVCARLQVLRLWRESPGLAVHDMPPEIAVRVTDAAFLDQLTPGRLERAAQELPRYIEALRTARREP